MTGPLTNGEDFAGSAPQKRKQGRPQVDDLRVQRPVKMNSAEWAKVTAAAKAAGLPTSVYVRRKLLA